jgi:putative CocE/NonD family hydrolase
MDDQRQAASRPDVLVYETEPLAAPLRVAGEPWARLFASTTGSDADWVVKLIDVWPSQYAPDARMGGYQQMISADIFRGRFREDFAKSKAIEPNRVLEYRIRLPQANHTFLPGHRVMVQIQSSWFPLYDRNPQSFVPNIMFAPPESYIKATHRVWRSAEQASAIELPVIP